jgi:hypothetical protein
MMTTNLRLLIVVRRGSYSVDVLFFLAAAVAVLLTAAAILLASSLTRMCSGFLRWK